MTLWHFTCADHGYAGIGKRGLLKPRLQPFVGAQLVWLTSEPWPDRQRTGLGMTYTRCDRMAYRYRVTDTSACRLWLSSDERAACSHAVLVDLEGYGNPAEWWVADEPVPVRLA